MPEPLDPSDLYYALTPDRLAVIGREVWDARVLAATTARWHDGATKFSVGLHAWLYGKTRLAKLAVAGTHPWLSVSDEGPKFVIKMGGCPLRFCSGDDESPLRANYRHPLPRERLDLQLAFAASELTKDDVFVRLLVTADEEGMPVALFLAECDLRTGDINNAWRIRLSGEGGTGVAAFVAPKPPVVLPGLNLETHEEAKEREQEEKVREAERDDSANPRGA